jgi:DNA-binding protein HU-beta
VRERFPAQFYLGGSGISLRCKGLLAISYRKSLLFLGFFDQIRAFILNTSQEVAVASLTKAELLERISTTTEIAKSEAEKVLATFFETVTEAARKGEAVAWPGFGKFAASSRAARMGRNPQTGAAVKIPASVALRFSPSSVLKAALNTKPNRKSAAKKSAAPVKAAAKKAPAKKAAPAKAAPARKAAVKKAAPAKAAPARKAAVKKAAPAKAAPAKKAAVKKAAARR